MACFRKDADDFNSANFVTVIGAEVTDEKYTIYTIRVTLGKYFWTVQHRYREFLELHEKLVLSHGIKKSLLPGKKLFGNQSEAFVKKRQIELEVYLQTLVFILQKLPPILGHFLDFNKYEIHGITASLAEELFNKGEWLLHTDGLYQLTPLHLHAITERLKLAEPTCESGDPKHDIGHVLDFLTRLRHLRVIGSTNTVEKSNINMNDLEFDLSHFKGLQVLELHNCSAAKILGLDTIKRNLKKICAHRSVKAVKDLLIHEDTTCWNPFDEDGVSLPEWSKVSWLDLSDNDVGEMDESLKLLPRVEYLDFHNNRLEGVAYLSHLSCLTHLDLSNNCIHLLSDLHTKLGNIKSLNLAGNKLESLQGIAKLYSLEYLDVGNNEISQILEIRHVAHLPCLENLNLSGNPVTVVLDYRIKVLQLFGNRANEVSLDNQKINEREMDTLAVLMAIQKAREIKERGKRTQSRMQSVEVNIEERTESKDAAAGTSDGETAVTQSEVGTLQLKIESIREKAGEGWLQTLNALQNTPPVKVHDFDSPYVSPNLSPGPAPPTTIVLTHNRVAQSQPPPVLPVLVHGLLPVSLPKMEDAGFMSYIQTLAQQTDLDLDNSFTEVIWCHLIYQPNPTIAFPCCVALTKSSLHLYELVDTDTVMMHREIPRLKFHHQINLDTITHVVTGMNDVYMKVFSRASNVVLICLDSNPPFMDLMMRFKTNRGCDHVEYSCESDEIQRVLESHTEAGDVLLYALCVCSLAENSDSQSCLSKTKEVYAVVVTNTKLFLARHNYFRRVGDVSSILDVVKTFSLEGDVENVVTFSAPEGAYQSVKVFFVDTKGGSKVDLMLYMADNLLSFGFAEFFKISGDQNIGKSNVLECESHAEITSGATLIDRLDDQQDLDQQSSSQVKHVEICTDIKTVTSTSATESVVVPDNQLVAEKHSPEEATPRVSPQISPLPAADSGDGLSLSDAVVSTCGADNSGVDSATKVSDACISKDDWAVIDTVTAAGSDIRHVVSTDMPSSVVEGQLSSSLNFNSASIPPIVAENLFETGIPGEPVDVEHVKKRRSRHKRNKKGLMSPDSISTASSGSLNSSPTSTPERSIVSRSLQHIQEARKTETSAQLRAAFSKTEQESRPSSGSALDSDVDVVDTRQSSDGPVREDMSSLYALLKEDTSQTVKHFHAMPKDNPSPENIPVVTTSTMSPGAPLRLNIASPPVTLSLGYPSRELLVHLGKCNQSMDLINPLTKQMNGLASMTGEEVMNFFHSAIVQIGSEGEELCHLVWACVIPFIQPKQEIITCVMLSTRAVYFVSDSLVLTGRVSTTSFRSHTRNKSDSLVSQRSSTFTGSPSYSSTQLGPRAGVVKPYHILQLSDLKHVNVGMFDQSFRLAGATPESVYSCVTRNHEPTEAFVKQLSKVLMLYSATPSPDLQSSGEDFYKSSRTKRSLSAVSKGEFEHPSRVKFHYANEDLIVDLTYVIHERTVSAKTNVEDTNILLYLLLFQMEAGSSSSPGESSRQARAKPRTLVVTDYHLTLLDEDLVNYPFPDFVVAPPSVQHYKVLEIRNVEYLKRVVLSDFKSHDLTLVFSDLTDEIVVDTSVEYFGAETTSASSSLPIKEISWVLAIQSLRDKDRLLKLVSRLWSEFHGDKQLSVQVNE